MKRESRLEAARQKGQHLDPSSANKALNRTAECVSVKAANSTLVCNKHIFTVQSLKYKCFYWDIIINLVHWTIPNKRLSKKKALGLFLCPEIKLRCTKNK